MIKFKDLKQLFAFLGTIFLLSKLP